MRTLGILLFFVNFFVFLSESSRTVIKELQPGSPGPVSFVELWVQSKTVLSVTFEEPEITGESTIDMYLVEWSLSDNFSEANQGFVLVSRIRPSSFQFDIVQLPPGMKEQVYVRVIAHNQQGWGAPTPSKPSHLAIADDEKAPESSSRSFESAKLFGISMSRVVHWIALLCACVFGLVCIGCICFNYCCSQSTAASSSHFNGDYQPVSRIENIDLDDSYFNDASSFSSSHDSSFSSSSSSSSSKSSKHSSRRSKKPSK